jgi:predicted enzyme related to lactoylglutathione lyase
MGDPVTNWEINSADPAKARKFYSDVLGWKMNFMPENNYTFVDTDAGGKGIGGGIGPLRGPKPFVTFYVVVKDLNATMKKATDGGGKSCSRSRRSDRPRPSGCSAIPTGTSSASPTGSNSLRRSGLA